MDSYERLKGWRSCPFGLAARYMSYDMSLMCLCSPISGAVLSQKRASDGLPSGTVVGVSPNFRVRTHGMANGSGDSSGLVGVACSNYASSGPYAKIAKTTAKKMSSPT